MTQRFFLLLKNVEWKVVDDVRAFILQFKSSVDDKFDNRALCNFLTTNGVGSTHKYSGTSEFVLASGSWNKPGSKQFSLRYTQGNLTEFEKWLKISANQKGFWLELISSPDQDEQEENTHVEDSNKRCVDMFETSRGCAADHKYFTPNLALYYGNKCEQNVTEQIMIRTLKVIEDYLVRIPNDFGITMNKEYQQQRFTVYMTNSGLHPNPSDPGDGVAGYASDTYMALRPDIFIHSASDQAIIVHELGHALFRVTGINWGMEEGLCEFLAHHYCPECRTIYDVTKSFIVQEHYRNIFSDKSRKDHAYDIGAFWVYINYKYGSKMLGQIADVGLSQSKVDAWNCVASHLSIRDADLIMAWVASLLTMEFWKCDAITKKYMQEYLGSNPTPLSKTYNWMKPTLSDISAIDNRLEKGGFEVLEYIDGLESKIVSKKNLGFLLLCHYDDGTSSVMQNPFLQPQGKPTKRFLIAVCLQ